MCRQVGLREGIEERELPQVYELAEAGQGSRIRRCRGHDSPVRCRRETRGTIVSGDREVDEEMVRGVGSDILSRILARRTDTPSHTDSEGVGAAQSASTNTGGKDPRGRKSGDTHENVEYPEPGSVSERERRSPLEELRPGRTEREFHQPCTVMRMQRIRHN